MLFRYPQGRKCTLSSYANNGPGLHRKLQITAQTVHRNVKKDENPQSLIFAVKICSVWSTDVSHSSKRSLYYTVCIAGGESAADLDGKRLRMWANPPSKGILVPAVRFHPFKRQLCLWKFGKRGQILQSFKALFLIVQTLPQTGLVQLLGERIQVLGGKELGSTSPPSPPLTTPLSCQG